MLSLFPIHQPRRGIRQPIPAARFEDNILRDGRRHGVRSPVFAGHVPERQLRIESVQHR
ncbi:hypothetical protein [Bacteroides zoogleoformans]|uniref:hypothetical protein n=1 Tax=Bacteroides zoogleoformans TaxID=28119 RepID=UPI001478D354|nr:hypothetical protein [Bacteroides zoogleoformans]